jgi:hypothetical protein
MHYIGIYMEPRCLNRIRYDCHASGSQGSDFNRLLPTYTAVFQVSPAMTITSFSKGRFWSVKGFNLNSGPIGY